VQRYCSEDVVHIVLGNKADLDRSLWKVQEDEVRGICERHNARYALVSAKEGGDDLEEILRQMCREYLERIGD